MIKTDSEKEKSIGKNHFKETVKNVVQDAAHTLDEAWNLWEIDPKSSTIREQFYLLEHYLDYIKRLCEQ